MMHRAGSPREEPARRGKLNYGQPHSALCSDFVQRFPRIPNRNCTSLPLVGQTRVFLGASHKRLGYRRNRGMLCGHNRPFKSYLQHFIHGLD